MPLQLQLPHHPPHRPPHPRHPARVDPPHPPPPPPRPVRPARRPRQPLPWRPLKDWPLIRAMDLVPKARGPCSTILTSNSSSISSHIIIITTTTSTGSSWSSCNRCRRIRAISSRIRIRSHPRIPTPPPWPTACSGSPGGISSRRRPCIISSTGSSSSSCTKVRLSRATLKEMNCEITPDKKEGRKCHILIGFAGEICSQFIGKMKG